MVPFNADHIHVQYFRMKSCTSALSGSAMVMDEVNSRPGKEVFRKIMLSREIVRRFVKVNKISKFVKTVPIAVTYYKDMPVAIESHPLGMAGELICADYEEGTLGHKWVSKSEANISRFIKPLTRAKTWFIDGKYVYHISEKSIDDREPLTSDGSFCLVNAEVIRLIDAGTDFARHTSIRKSIGYFTDDDGAYSLSSPIWRKFDKGAGSKDVSECQFDVIDDHYSVNLHFALRAGREISEVLGYEAIAPLNLPDLMVALNTVNLPSLDESIKNTFAIGIKFTHAVAWLLGLAHRNRDEKFVSIVGGLLKCLTTNGVFHRSLTSEESVLKGEYSLDTVPLISYHDASQVDDNSVEAILRQARLRNRTNGYNNRVGNLYNVD